MSGVRGAKLIDGAMLRDAVVCGRRVWHASGTPEIMADQVTPSLERLWAGGSASHGEVVAVLLAEGGLDLRGVPAVDRKTATRAAMVGGAAHVIGAEFSHADMVARPDVVSRVDGRWHAGMVRAGPLVGEDGEAADAAVVEIALAAHLLGVSGLGAGDRGFLLGAGGERVWIAMAGATASSTGSPDRTLQRALERVRAIIGSTVSATGAMLPACGTCRWRSLCRSELGAADDLTLLHGVDRTIRRRLRGVATTVSGLAALDAGALVSPAGRSLVRGIAPAALLRLRDRARLLGTPGAGPFARVPLGLRRAARELHPVAAADPARDGFVFAHAALERAEGPAGAFGTIREHLWLADGPSGERDAWAGIWGLLSSGQGARVYLQDEAQRAAYRRLAHAHPDVCEPASLERLLASARVVVLREGVIEPRTEWPVQDYSVESLAAFVTHGSPFAGAHAAIRAAWHDSYATTADPALRGRIEDACREACEASARVLDVLAALPVEGPPGWRAPPTVDGAAVFEALGHARSARSLYARPAAQRRRKTEVRRAPAAVTIEAAHPQRAVYATPSLRPCAAITPEGGMTLHGFEQSWGALTEELPLVGAGALGRGADGRPLLAARLRARSPWLEPAIAAVERAVTLSLWRGAPWLSFPPLVIVGPPGCGKSDFARQLARGSGVPSASLDFPSMADALTLAGVARGWASSMPSWPARVMAESRVANPILFCDEVDKAAGTRSGNGGAPLDALLSMLEPSTAAAYPDRCLLTPVDLSACCWIGAANEAGSMPPVLLSRFEVVEVPAPGDEHFDPLLAGIIGDLTASWNLPAGLVADLPVRAVSVLRGSFSRHRSPRLLARHVRRVLPALLTGRPVLH